jgi:primosomal protein N' (replication factor Y)
MDKMDMVDIIFPQNIGPLTYRVPEEMRASIRPGLMVECEVKKRIKRGFVAGTPHAPVPSGTSLKEISGILHDMPSLSPALLKLVLWVSRYYVCREGLTLKGLFPSELFEPVKARGTGKVREPLAPFYWSGTDPRLLEVLKAFQAGDRKGGYSAFLHHAASTCEEFTFLLEAIRGRKNAIVVCPDKQTIAHLVPSLRSLFGERLVEYHSGLNRGQRSRAVEMIASGLADIVIGSLSAVFAPMPEVSLITVLSEENNLYKSESAPRFSARDAAVMRAYLEGSTALLSSICPSLESWRNTETGKYTLLDTATGAPRPKVRIASAWGRDSVVSETMQKAITKAMEQGERSLLYINRIGHSILRCDDCGIIERCSECDIPLVYHMKERLLRCSYCGNTKKLYEACPSCRGSAVTLTGMGLERIEDELKELLPVGVDSLRRENLSLIANDSASLGVGTKTLTRSAALAGTAIVSGVLNADALLHTPDFRSRERAFQDIIYASDMAHPEGELIVQTRYPNLPMIGYIKRFDFRRLYLDELKEREEAGYPPFSRLAVLDLRVRNEPELQMLTTEGVELLGPVAARLKPRKGRETNGYRVLLKAANRDVLHRAISEILSGFKSSEVDVDVDPVTSF